MIQFCKYNEKGEKYVKRRYNKKANEIIDITKNNQKKYHNKRILIFNL